LYIVVSGVTPPWPTVHRTFTMARPRLSKEVLSTNPWYSGQMVEMSPST